MGSPSTSKVKHDKALWLPWVSVYIASVIVIVVAQLSISLADYSAGDTYSGPITGDTVTIYAAVSIILGLLFALKYLPLIFITGRRLRRIATSSIMSVIPSYRRILFTTAALDLFLVALPAAWYYSARSEISGDGTLALPLAYLFIVFPMLILTTIGSALLLMWRLRRVLK